MCLYGENGKYRDGFFKFVDRSKKEAATEAVFKECFGIGYKAMGIELPQVD